MISLSASVTLLVAACGYNKVAECNQLIDGINKGHAIVTNFQGNDAAAANKLADGLDSTLAQLEKIELKDKQLQGFKSRFTEIYRDLSKAFRTTAKALVTAKSADETQAGLEKVKKARSEVEASAKIAEQAAEKADVLAAEINNYCLGKKAD
ncbi:MAG: hypothetical protein N3E45_11755 [Oscillatoriaceae bacterium SKW80]|nr:hypothetical protein [Oscillatoriaceae bacterium SKYG93]MCX8121477.1 hypothetical protein [Oscillatoriaceae bacterium SKW80]MDW8452937.1 hypothetical protein [Oscillatoriaceae cyanobacterium SKYGB_i_bin93]HIK27824.1 hypothetical protein [Oscillatoriaceae cyanobacterium M7585_C2015_266]